MPSSPTARNRLEKPGTGEQSNTWGATLNANVFDLADEALDGEAAYPLSGPKTLTATNYASDEARKRFQNITGGTGGTVTIPAVEKWYIVRNTSAGDVVFTTGTGTSATIRPDNVSIVLCDGTNVYLGQHFDFGAVVPKSTGTPTVGSHLINKTYADGLAFAAADLPGQTGNAGKFLTTNGTNASWGLVTVSGISDIAANYVGIGSAQTISGAKTFSSLVTANAGISINAQTLDGLTAAGVALIEAANVSAQRAALELSKASTAQFRAQVGDVVITCDSIANGCAIVNLTDAATISVDWTSGIVFEVALGGNRLLGNPTNVVVGTSRQIFIKATTGTRSLSFGTHYKGDLPVLSDITTIKWYLLTLVAYSSTHIAVATVRAL